MPTENTLNHAHLFCKTLDAVSREDLVNGVHQALMQINAVEKGVESLDNRPIQAILSGLLKKAGHIGFEAQMTTKQFLEEIVELAKQLPLEVVRDAYAVLETRRNRRVSVGRGLQGGGRDGYGHYLWRRLPEGVHPARSLRSSGGGLSGKAP